MWRLCVRQYKNSKNHIAITFNSQIAYQVPLWNKTIAGFSPYGVKGLPPFATPPLDYWTTSVICALWAVYPDPNTGVAVTVTVVVPDGVTPTAAGVVVP